MHRRSLAATLNLTNVQLRFKVLIGLSTALGTAGILWIGARQAMAGKSRWVPFSLFFRTLGALYTPIESVMYFIHDPGRGGKRPASVGN